MRSTRLLRYRLAAAAALLFSVAFPGLAWAGGEMEGQAFCSLVKQSGEDLKRQWGLSELTLFGCHTPSATQVADKPLTYQAQGMIWFKGVTLQGESIKGRREARGMITKTAAGDEWALQKVDFGGVESLSFLRQSFAWLALCVFGTALVGLGALVLRSILPAGLVNFVAFTFAVILVWSFGVDCFGSHWAGGFCTLAYLFVSGSVAKSMAVA